jgi:hypothetical protein
VITDVEVETALALEGEAALGLDATTATAREVTLAEVRPSIEHRMLVNMPRALAVSVP